jgi:hypothetical protein
MIKGRLMPGKMLCVDMEKNCVMQDHEIKAGLWQREPFEEWIKQKLSLDALVNLTSGSFSYAVDNKVVNEDERMKAFGFSLEQLNMLLLPMVRPTSLQLLICRSRMARKRWGLWERIRRWRACRVNPSASFRTFVNCLRKSPTRQSILFVKPSSCRSDALLAPKPICWPCLSNNAVVSTWYHLNLYGILIVALACFIAARAARAQECVDRHHRMDVACR